MQISKIRPFIQVLFFIIFLWTFISGQTQFWMVFVFLSIIFAGIFGRYYCGFICPINTIIHPIQILKDKAGFSSKNIPNFLKSEKPRLLLMLLFIVGLGITVNAMINGSRFPLPIIIISIGILTTLLFNENSWHRYLCPWGFLLSITGHFSNYGLNVNEKCISCKICENVCPAEAVKVENKQNAEIFKKHCLLCLKCELKCPTNAITYKKL
ncbi:polyferredoxin [Methanococcus maripaludis]|uniref:Polyferredoxin n=1 Tax=Methanococcus maripaludis TaxID=39152 RepID=A0A7J9P582_METMI|nr:4Fe-4S binding protein [Methanococcus maripaludis]MBA2858371.1 polyferredoxin [Methanococcus maripaludis]